MSSASMSDVRPHGFSWRRLPGHRPQHERWCYWRFGSLHAYWCLLRGIMRLSWLSSSFLKAYWLKKISHKPASGCCRPFLEFSRGCIEESIPGIIQSLFSHQFEPFCSRIPKHDAEDCAITDWSQRSPRGWVVRVCHAISVTSVGRAIPETIDGIIAGLHSTL